MIALILAAALTCAPVATDGDTIRCGHERIRLLGIDAPEMPGHCRRGRVCVTGDPYASRANMIRLLQARPLTIRRFGADRYGRTLAMISAGGQDISCAQIKQRAAVYVARWDNDKALAKACPVAAK